MLFWIPLAVMLYACTDEITPEAPVEEVEAIVEFQKEARLVSEESEVGNLAQVGERLYFSDSNFPGYFNQAFEPTQFVKNFYAMKFGQVFTQEYTLAVYENRRSLVLIPNVEYYDDYTIYLNALNIPELPSDYLLQPGKTELPNFGLSGNFLLSSWEKPLGTSLDDPGAGVFILELNAQEYREPGKVIVDKAKPVLNKIPLRLDIDKIPVQISQLLTVFSFEDGWLATVEIGGLRYSVRIGKDGSVNPLSKELDGYTLLGVEMDSKGGLFVTHEEGLFYSPSGDPRSLQQIAAFTAPARFCFAEDRMIVWTVGSRIYEFRDYLDLPNAKLLELQNKGLEGLRIRDVALFNGRIFVATNEGLFFKEEDFWKEIESTSKAEQSLGY